MDNLRSFDLNLLVVLDALLEERHVTRAADRIGLGQPATSAALKRLRAHFDDPLLVRSRGEMFLTEAGAMLREPVKEALRHAALVVRSGAQFVPEEIDRRFRIAMTDYAGYLLAPGLLSAIQAQAPLASIDFVTLDRQRLVQSLTLEEIDAAVVTATNTRGNIVSKPLFRDELVFVAAPDHPLAARRKLTLRDIAAYSFIGVSFARPLLGALYRRLSGAPGWSEAAMVPHFLLVPEMVAGTEHISVLGRKAAIGFRDSARISVLDAQTPMPKLDYSLVWHKRQSDDPSHKWLRTLFTA